MTPDVIEAKPFVEFLAPYVNIIVPPIVTALIGWAALKFQQVTHIQLQASAVASLKSAAATQAGALVAAAEDNLAGRSFTTNSPQVVAAAAAVATALPELVELAGATPDKLQLIVAAEIGKLQSNQTAPAVPTPKGN